MRLRGAGEIREDPFEGNRAPRDRFVEAFRAGVELDPERTTPGCEEVVRLTHLVAREARAVRDEDERDVSESSGVAHVEKRPREREKAVEDRKSTRLNSSHLGILYAVFCFKKVTIRLIVNNIRFDRKSTRLNYSPLGIS